MTCWVKQEIQIEAQFKPTLRLAPVRNWQDEKQDGQESRREVRQSE